MKLRLFSLLAMGICSGCITTDYPVNGSSTVQASSQKTAVLGNWKLQAMPAFQQHGSQAFYRRFTLKVESHRVSGAAFNNFFSDVSLGTNTLHISPQFSTTRKMVMGERGTMEKTYFARLIHANQWQIVGQQLTLNGDQGRLVFQRIP